MLNDQLLCDNQRDLYDKQQGDEDERQDGGELDGGRSTVIGVEPGGLRAAPSRRGTRPVS